MAEIHNIHNIYNIHNIHKCLQDFIIIITDSSVYNEIKYKIKFELKYIYNF